MEAVIQIGWESENRKRETDIRTNRSNIFTAMGFAGNHWYRCSNGHLYVVADCGALNQSGNCPECRARIGGGSQNVRAVRDESTIQQQINSVVDIFPVRNYTPPTFDDRSRNENRGHLYSESGGRRGRRW